MRVSTYQSLSIITITSVIIIIILTIIVTIIIHHHYHHRHHIGWGGKCGNNEVTCDLSGFGPKGRVLYCIAVLYSIVEPIIYLLLLGGEGGGGGHASDLVLSGDILLKICLSAVRITCE
jgi:hypothetical protein